MKTVAVIQARMGSSRLPGKMMLHLGEKESLAHVINRVGSAKEIDEITVATSDKNEDLVIARLARELGVSVHRGDEYDVLGRMYNAAIKTNADHIIRICGDCSFVSPQIIDYLTVEAENQNIDYLSNKILRTFPLGLDVEVFTMNSFESLEQKATKPHEREHVTSYYIENPNEFSIENITSNEIFDQKWLQDRTDVELVLDEPADYFYLDEIYSSLPSTARDIRSVINYIDKQDIKSEISNVSRKGPTSVENNDRRQTNDEN